MVSFFQKNSNHNHQKMGIVFDSDNKYPAELAPKSAENWEEIVEW
jgi:hypothetical protein